MIDMMYISLLPLFKGLEAAKLAILFLFRTKHIAPLQAGFVLAAPLNFISNAK